MKSCLHTALSMLSRRDHSCHELGVKLAHRGFEPSQIAAAIAECRRLAYLNDETFSHRYIMQLRRKGYGARRIAQSLKAKGVAPELIHSCMRHYGADERQLKDCRKVLSKKLKTATRLPNTEVKAKLYRFLFNRGFSAEIIHQVLIEGD